MEIRFAKKKRGMLSKERWQNEISALFDKIQLMSNCNLLLLDLSYWNSFPPFREKFGLGRQIIEFPTEKKHLSHLMAWVKVKQVFFFDRNTEVT